MKSRSICIFCIYVRSRPVKISYSSPSLNWRSVSKRKRSLSITTIVSLTFTNRNHIAGRRPLIRSNREDFFLGAPLPFFQTPPYNMRFCFEQHGPSDFPQAESWTLHENIPIGSDRVWRAVHGPSQGQNRVACMQLDWTGLPVKMFRRASL